MENRLTLFKEKVIHKHNKWHHEYLCTCGKIIICDAWRVKTGHTKSCGCVRIDRNKRDNSTHGFSKEPLYKVWKGMRGRCHNPKNTDYHNYGGRGINVCEDWKHKNNYPVFRKWAIENGYKLGLTIDREKVNEGYNPKNCRWITKEEQAHNTRKAIGWEKVLAIRASKLPCKAIMKQFNISKSSVWKIQNNFCYKNNPHENPQ